MEKGVETLNKLSHTTSKLKIMELLYEPKSLSVISECLGLAKQTLLPHLKVLLNLGFIERVGDKYVITRVGEAACKKFLDTAMCFEVLVSLREFFQEHDLSPIPERLLYNIHMLNGGRIFVKNSPYELHEEWLNILFNSNWIYGLASIYNKDFPQLFNDLSKERKTKLILTEDVYSQVEEFTKAELDDYLDRGEMFVCDSVKITFIVAEQGFTMNLYSNSYDSSNILICKTEDAVEWSIKLFNYYLSQSKKIEI